MACNNTTDAVQMHQKVPVHLHQEMRVQMHQDMFCNFCAWKYTVMCVVNMHIARHVA